MDNSKAVAAISDEAVQAALTADQGEDTKLESWKNVPFTNKGDNYASFVTGIAVNYTKGGQKKETSYVVKLNPCKPQWDPELPDLVPMLFEKEGKFYLEILPEFNLFMTQNGQKLLPFPKCYYAQYVEGKEMIIFEDLRLKGFKMTDRRKGLDLQHAILVMQGLGKLHAASIIMQNKKSIDDIKSQYPFLSNEIWAGKFLECTFSKNISIWQNMLSKCGGHEKAINWLDKIETNLVEFFLKNYSIVPPFTTICHGDCWNNNILFRYDDSGLPVEVMLLDVQVNRLASLATDLNYFLFTSLEGTVRKPNLDRLLTDYYASFRSVIEGCAQNLPFTKEELVQEYKSKNGFGLLVGTEIAAPITMESEDFPDTENITPENFEQFMEDWQKKCLDSIDKNPLCKPRFVAMYDEMLEEGLFS